MHIDLYIFIVIHRMRSGVSKQSSNRDGPDDTSQHVFPDLRRLCPGGSCVPWLPDMLPCTLGGNHLSNTMCVTHTLFKSVEQCSKLS